MIGCTLSGVTFINWQEVDINLQDQVIVKEKEEYSDEQEIALGVYLDTGKHIGYIPLLSTINKWRKAAFEEQDEKKFNYLTDKYKATEVIRDNIINDMFRNKLMVQGVVSRIVTDDETGNIKSVGVSFDYM